MSGIGPGLDAMREEFFGEPIRRALGSLIWERARVRFGRMVALRTGRRYAVQCIGLGWHCRMRRYHHV